jgi:acetylornithine/succinyldiaminopimelate/putrescine aminotransferase
VLKTAKAPEHATDALFPVYAQMPVRPVRGHGSCLIDAEGNQWLDAYGGHAVASTGHCHPHVVEAIARQAGTLLFYSTAVVLEVRERLAAELVKRYPGPGARVPGPRTPDPGPRVFFCNSGAEANENALHLARRTTGRSGVVAVEGGWHGRTVATLACTHGEKYQAWARAAGMPLARFVPFNDVAALERTVDESTAALIIEPVQGVQGARDCSPEFLRAARAVCDRHGAALIFDEIQCGVGRCGAFTAAEAYGVTPDVIAMAKGLASGLPIGAILVGSKLAAGVKTGDLGSTFGGGPVVCAAALATLEVIDREGLIANAIAIGERLTQGALALGVSKVQGRGLLLGLHLGRPAVEVQKALFARRILTGTSADPQVLRLMPPLVFSAGEADRLLEALAEVLR